MQELELDWRRVASVWWLLTWRGALGAFVVGYLLGMGFIFLAPQVLDDPRLGIAVNLATGLLIVVLWYPVVVWMALKKKYGGFRIALIAHEP